MRIAVVQGTRPEIIKNYSIVSALRQAGVEYEVLHTNQHSSAPMAADIYRQLGYEPTLTMPGSYKLGLAIDWLQDTYMRLGIRHVIVNGDTAASIAGALAAMYLDIPVSHVEAGLRSGDPDMLEERNRIMVDSIAHFLFAYTEVEQQSLTATPSIRGRVFLEGNTTVDVLHDFAHLLGGRRDGDPYIYVTLHRKEFTDSRERMVSVFHTLRKIAAHKCRIIFPMHPRTRDAARRHKIPLHSLGSVEVLEPVSTFESFALQRHAAAVLTDSGCIQEEAYLLNIPCVTIRSNTERHLTVANGGNVVTGFEPASIQAATHWALTTQHKPWPTIYGEPGAGRRIVATILAHSSGPRSDVRPELGAATPS